MQCVILALIGPDGTAIAFLELSRIGPMELGVIHAFYCLHTQHFAAKMGLE